MTNVRLTLTIDLSDGALGPALDAYLTEPMLDRCDEQAETGIDLADLRVDGYAIRVERVEVER